MLLKGVNEGVHLIYQFRNNSSGRNKSYLASNEYNKNIFIWGFQ